LSLAYCHKHLRRPSPVINKQRRLLLPPMSVIACVTLCGLTVDNTRWNKILVENRDFCLTRMHSKPQLGGSPSEYCHNVWCGKTILVWQCGYPTVKKNFEDIFIHLDRIHERGRRTETARRHRPRLCIASRDKNYNDHKR